MPSWEQSPDEPALAQALASLLDDETWPSCSHPSYRQATHHDMREATSDHPATRQLNQLNTEICASLAEICRTGPNEEERLRTLEA